jgi:hypothetical protein
MPQSGSLTGQILSKLPGLNHGGGLLLSLSLSLSLSLCQSINQPHSHTAKRIFLLETGELFADQINIRLAKISLPTTVLEEENCQKRENNFGVKNKKSVNRSRAV